MLGSTPPTITMTLWYNDILLIHTGWDEPPVPNFINCLPKYFYLCSFFSIYEEGRWKNAFFRLPLLQFTLQVILYVEISYSPSTVPSELKLGEFLFSSKDSTSIILIILTSIIVYTGWEKPPGHVIFNLEPYYSHCVLKWCWMGWTPRPSLL